MSQFNLTHRTQGMAIILLMIILIVATGIGIWGLTSSRSSLLKAGSRKFATELTYQAEQGLQKAVRRIQTIADASDQVAVTNDTNTQRSGGNYTPKKIDFLVNPSGGLCAEGTTGCTTGINSACTNFNALLNFDNIDVNVICNFLGVVDMNTQVSVVRKADLINGSDVFAIFLVNSVANDENGRKQAIQGVVVVPYLNSSGTFSKAGAPYLASSKAVTD